MNEESTTDSASKSPFRMGLRESVFAHGLAASLCGLWMIQFENLNLLGLVIIVTFFLIGIFLRRSWGIYIMFGSLIFLKLADVSPQFRPDLKVITWSDISFTVIAILFGGLCFRYLELSKYVKAFYPAAKVPTDLKDKATYQFPSLLGGRWWLIPLAVFLATVLLWLFPHDPESRNRYWITSYGSRIIFLTFFLFFLWFICRSLISLLMRWNIGPEQAEIRVRSLVAKEFWRETWRGKASGENSS